MIYNNNFAFVERNGTMKAPVGLLSDRTVLRSKMEGPRPDKFAFVALCGALQTHFHGKGRNGKRHVAAVGLSPSRSDYKSAEHKKSSSGATWIFCMEPNCFGVTRGEQPLVCNGNDRGQRPKQGGAVGAAACRMRVPRKARSRRREPQPAASRASKVAETLPR